jgi:DNA-directed RNA polymerase I subunit RPA43
MAVDAMDIDTSPRATDERKRKSKNKDASPSKKRKQTESKSKSKKDKSSKTASTSTSTLNGHSESPFSLATATLYLPLSPISISPTTALASLMAEHLSPLLLTYYPPLKGIVMAYSNASIASHPPSSKPRNSSDPKPQPLTLAKTADEYGVLYVYLTATFLVFRPRRGQSLEGWVNVQSEGFLGAVVFNLFSVGIERKRLPTNWRWVPPGEEAEASTTGNGNATTDDESGPERAPPGFDPAKELFQPAPLAAGELDIDGEDEDEASTGHFQSVSGHRVRGNVRFRVVDVDVIPGSERDRGFLSIEGTMLTPEEEEKLVHAENQGQSLPPSFLSSSVKKTTRVIPISKEPPASSVQDVSVVEIEPEQEKKKEKKDKKDKKEKKEKKERKEKKSKSKKEK